MRSSFTRSNYLLFTWGLVLVAASVMTVTAMTGPSWLKSNVFELLPDSDYDPLTEIERGTRTRRHLVAGEILVAQDVTGSTGPAATADDGDAVVLVPHRTPVALEAGLSVRVVGDGVVLAETATVMSSVGEIAFVAVPEESAPLVADAVRKDVATLVFLP